MKFNNNFQKYAVNQVWINDPYCAKCSSNQGCAVHHIYGRKGEFNKSIYNGILLCFNCHREADCFNTDEQGDEFRIHLLSIAIKMITKSIYKNITRDTRFLTRHKEDFEKAIVLIKSNVI